MGRRRSSAPAEGASAGGVLCGMTAAVAAKVILLALNLLGGILACSLIGALVPPAPPPRLPPPPTRPLRRAHLREIWVPGTTPPPRFPLRLGLTPHGVTGLGAYRTKYGKIVQETFKSGSLGLFDDPYMAMIIFGCGLLLISTKGFFGALWQKRRVLLAYFAIMLVMVSALVFGAAICFTFQEKADIIITKYMDRLKDTPYEHTGLLDKYYADSHEFVDGVNRKLGAAGGIFTLCASCVLAAMGCAAVLMGLKYTLQSSTAVTNFATLVGGGVVLYLAIASKVEHFGGTWVPELFGVAGGLMCLISVVGICAINAERRRVLQAHFAVMVIVALLFAACAVAAFAYSRQTRAYIDKNWDRINERLIGGMSKAEAIAWWEAHLVLLGMGASIATTLLTLNLVADLYMLLIVPKASSYDALDDTAGKNPLREPPPPTVGLRRFSSKRGGGPGDESKV